MNQGLAILMERIDTNPEEFIGKSSTVTHMSRWGTLIDIATDPARSGTFITPEERAALVAKLAVVRGEYFHKEVLRKLMDAESGDDSSAHTEAYKRQVLATMEALNIVPTQGLVNAQLGNASSTVQVRRPGLADLIRP
jgi:hypothetical protein